MTPQADVNIDHASRISVLEAHVSNIKTDLDQIVQEVGSIRKAIWIVALVLALNSTPILQDLLKNVLSLL